MVLGGGDGLLIRELLKHEGVHSITHVDLDRTLVELARTHPTFTAMNRGALEDPRVRTEYGDAYQYIRRSTETFDAIYMDFPYVKDYEVAKLLRSCEPRGANGAAGELASRILAWVPACDL